MALDQEVMRILDKAWNTGKIVEIASKKDGNKPSYVAKKIGVTPSQLNFYFMNVLAHGDYREWYLNEIKARRTVDNSTHLIPDRRKRGGKREAPIFDKYNYQRRDSPQRISPAPEED